MCGLLVRWPPAQSECSPVTHTRPGTKSSISMVDIVESMIEIYSIMKQVSLIDGRYLLDEVASIVG